jgi:hypothetical protein
MVGRVFHLPRVRWAFCPLFQGQNAPGTGDRQNACLTFLRAGRLEVESKA